MQDISQCNLTAVRRPPVWMSAANVTGEKLRDILVAIRILEVENTKVS
jgi:hypothetical protein